MRDVLDIILEIIVAIAGAVAIGAVTVGGTLFLVGCALFGSCWTFLGWRKRRAARLKNLD
jgi:hypothetical protein